MSYVSSTLQTGENLRVLAYRHWIIYLGPLAWGVAGVLLAVLASPFTGAGSVFPGLMLVGGIGLSLMALMAAFGVWFKNWTTELAVTNRRVIFKSGFIRRNTEEMNMDKIESVVVSQTLFGRLLNYGTIYVKGTGQSIEPLQFVRTPLAVRDSITAR
jgi:uncharacterized membrane protein YdbT with pleckstrin-like domain